MSVDKSREQFEEWFNREVFNLKLATANDVNLVNCYWDAWQASRAAIEVELPNEKPHRHNSYPEVRAQDDGFNDGISQCALAIIEQGLKVKK